MAALTASCDTLPNSISQSPVTMAATTTNTDTPIISTVTTGDAERIAEPPSVPAILYKIEWTQDDDGVKQPPFESDTPFENLQVTASIDQGSLSDKRSKPVVEIVTKINGINTLLRGQIFEDLEISLGSAGQETPKDATKDDADTSQNPTPIEKKKNLVRLEDVAITKIGTTKMIIHSLPLLQALRSLVVYYPDQYLTGEEVEISEPYAILVHHIDELRAIARSGECKTTVKSLSEKSVADVRTLLDFMDPFFNRIVSPIEERLSRYPPDIRFDDLWYLFKPGEDVYVKMLDKIVAGVMMNTKQKGLGAMDGRPENLEVGYWVLSSDGVKLDREDDTEAISKFEGEREVTSLALFPARFWDMKDNSKRRKNFEKRGEMYFTLLCKGNKQMSYDGKTFPLRNRTVCQQVHIIDLIC
jgi:hypothetical protein